MSDIIHLHHINFLSVRYPKERKKERQSLEEISIGHAARLIDRTPIFERSFFGSGCFVQ
jgi:hypothetical protein